MPAREIEIPADLDALVLACLEKDPKQRPQTALELAERLSALTLTREWTNARAKVWWKKHRPSQLEAG